MNAREDEKLRDALTELLGEERQKRKRASLFPVFAMVIGAISLSVCSFFLYEEESQSGGFAAAREVFEGFLEENEAIAVFLGLGEENEMR